MSLFTKLGNEIASPVDAAGNPRAVENVDMQRWMTEVERATLAFQAGGGIIFPDLETANASLAYAQNQMAWVIGDPVPANNGVYRKIGASGSGSWARLGDLPISMIRLDNAGAGTADAIIAEPMLPLPTTPGAALLTVNILAANTGSVTLNGKPLRTNSGNEIAPGGLTAGSIHAFLDLGDHFRLLSDQASAAIVAAAEAARDAALAAVPNAFPEDRTALKALNTATITAAYLKEPGREGQWLWDASVPVATHQADTDENRYVAPNPAADGAWVRAASVSTGKFFENENPRARIERIADRLMLGEAVSYNGLPFGGGGDGSWIWSQGGGATKMGWIEAGAMFASATSRGLALSGIARNTDGGTAIGASGWAMHDKDLSSGRAWGGYFEGVLNHASGRAKGIEVDATNLVDHNFAHTPYTGLGDTMALWVAAGGDPRVNPISYNVDSAIGIGYNGARFNAGIVINNNGLARDGGSSGRGHAILMAFDHAIEWYEPASNTIGLSVVSQISAAANKEELSFDDAGMRLKNASGVTFFSVTRTANAINRIDLQSQSSGIPPAIRAIGIDTNVDLHLVPQGAGYIRLQAAAAVVGNASSFAAERYFPIKLANGAVYYVPAMINPW